MPSPNAADIRIIDGISEGELRGLRLAPDMGVFWRNWPDLQHDALLKIVRLPGGHVTVACDSSALVGFVALLPPEETSRWHGIEGIWELEGIEVSRSRRGQGIARRLIAAVFANPLWEERLVIGTAYRWCWDMDYMGLTVPAYQRLLEKLAGPFSFRAYATDDPDIVRYPGNVFAARVGSRVPPAVYEAFAARLVNRP